MFLNENLTNVTYLYNGSDCSGSTLLQDGGDDSTPLWQSILMSYSKRKITITVEEKSDLKLYSFFSLDMCSEFQRKKIFLHFLAYEIIIMATEFSSIYETSLLLYRIYLVLYQEQLIFCSRHDMKIESRMFGRTSPVVGI